MDRVSIQDLRSLVDSGVAPCVTIQLPTEPTGKEGLADELRLKNLTQQAEEELATHWMRGPEARKMLQPIRDLPKDLAVWKQRGRGLAVFVDPNSYHLFRLPQPLPEFLHIGQRFHIKALVPLVDQGERFLILTLSQNRTRLFEANRAGASEVDVAGLPERLDEALQLDGADRGEQVHSGGDFGVGKQAGVFHGQGGRPDARKDDLKLYFRAVNQALSPVLRREQLPLIVAGVEYLLPIFRETCDYSGLATGQVSGNFDHLNIAEIHRHVWPVMEPLLNAPRRSVAAKLQQLIDTGKASDNPKDVLMAAIEGRVATLFVDPRRHQWGAFEEGNKRVDLHREFEPGDDDLLEVVTGETLRRGGDVYSTDAIEPPGREAMAAVYRY